MSSKQQFNTLQYYFKMSSTLQKISMNKQAIFGGCEQILLFLRGPRMVFQQFCKYIGATVEKWTNRNQEFYTVSQQETTRTAKKFSRYIFNKCQLSNHLNRVRNGNGDILSEDALKTEKKTGEVLFCYKTCSFFVQIF